MKYSLDEIKAMIIAENFETTTFKIKSKCRIALSDGNTFEGSGITKTRALTNALINAQVFYHKDKSFKSTEGQIQDIPHYKVDVEF